MAFADITTVIAASSATGKKVFLPGFLFSLLVNLNLVHLPGEIAFLSSPWAAVLLGVLAALEIAADFFPGVGSALQSVKLFVVPVASALLAYCMLGEADTGLRVALMLVCAVCGEAVQVASTGVSMASAQMSGGGGDPLVNIEEVISSTGIVLLAVFLPVLSVVLVVLVIGMGIAGFVLYRRWKRRKAEQRRALGEALRQERESLLADIGALAPADASAPALSLDAEERLKHLNRKLEVNRQALFDYEAQGYFPVPAQFRRKGYLYAGSKRLALVVMLLSVIPGLGHVYAGQWQKGLVILGVSVGIDFLLTPLLLIPLLGIFFPLAFLPPVVYRLIVFTDLEMIRQKLNGSIPVKPFEFF